MPQVGETARVRLKGSTGVDHNAPLEVLSQEVYRVARKYAEVNNFKSHVHTGPHGPVKGVAGPMIMSTLIRQLFPTAHDEEAFKITRGLIMQVLRKTDAAVCIKQHPPRERGAPFDRENMPVWFVADHMPANIVVVALAHARHSVETVNSRTPEFSERNYLTKSEKRLSPEEVERQPGEVTTVTPSTVAKSDQTPSKTKQSPAVEQAFDNFRDRIKEQHEALLQRVLEELQTNPVPLTGPDIAAIVGSELAYTAGSYAKAAAQLVESGKAVRRKETAAERRVRGGGQPPKGGASWLYAPAPGPVPVRTRLPDGVIPHRSARAWTDDAMGDRQSHLDLVMEKLTSSGSRGSQPPRTLSAITDATGLPRDRVKRLLNDLQGQGRVEHRKYSWYPVDTSKTEKKRSEQPSETPQPEPTAVPDVVTETETKPKPPAKSADDRNLELIQELANRLGTELPKGDAERIHELEVAVRGVSEQNVELLKQNKTLRSQVGALQAAIAAFQV
jgi:hypothetical protein